MRRLEAIEEDEEEDDRQPELREGANLHETLWFNYNLSRVSELRRLLPEYLNELGIMRARPRAESYVQNVYLSQRQLQRLREELAQTRTIFNNATLIFFHLAANGTGTRADFDRTVNQLLHVAAAYERYDTVFSEQARRNVAALQGALPQVANPETPEDTIVEQQERTERWVDDD